MTKVIINSIIGMTKFNYKEQHAVIVRYGSEEEQREIFEQLKSQGLTDLKIVSVCIAEKITFDSSVCHG